MQNDGNFVYYDNNWSPKWASGTNQDLKVEITSEAYPNKVVKSHKWLPGGTILASPNKKHILVYQWDGNLVIYSGSNVK